MSVMANLKNHGLESLGIKNPKSVSWNLSVSELISTALSRGEAKRATNGALLCYTGKHTGRSPKDRFIVEDETTRSTVDWGTVNQPMTPEHFERLRSDQLQYLEGKELFASDAYVGADRRHQVTVRAVNETAWANLFCRQLFRRYAATEAIPATAQFTIIHTPGFLAEPARHGTRTDTFIVVNFSQGLVLIGGTEYAGEQKKSIFSILNYLYPLQSIFPMHCSANISDTAPHTSSLFFGLSGTGKTTLSADPNRRLIGDDEHGWSDDGIFNFEGGCYAKCINLTKESEPQIWSALREGTVLENVAADANGNPDFADSSRTENTRAAYPLDFIEGAVPEGTGPHPKDIVFLTCDAFAVMPPIARLSSEQAMYHFLSGYTAKVAGTEKGLGSEPSATFSSCFGAPFLPLKPTTYATLLGKKIEQFKSNCWLINTGWSGGGVGVGSRMKLSYTRRMIDAALKGELNNVEYATDPVFGFKVPTKIEGVPAEVLNPRATWKNPVDYDAKASHLAKLFVDNFKKFEAHAPYLLAFGPKVKP